MQVEQHECQHRACKCMVASDETFCSPQCEEQVAKGMDATVCECQHDDCERTIGGKAGTAPAAA